MCEYMPCQLASLLACPDSGTLSHMTSPPVTAFGNLKGGVGKSTNTTSVAVARAKSLRARNSTQRVLVLDADSQGGTTRLILGERPTTGRDLGTVLTGQCRLDEAVIRLDDPAVIVSAEHREAWAGIDLVSAPNGRIRVEQLDYDLLRTVITEQVDADEYAAVFVDTGHGDADLTTLGLIAADQIIGVTFADYVPMEQLEALSTRLQKIGKQFPHVRDFVGVIVGNVDTRRGTDTAILEALAEIYGDRLLSPIVPSRVVVSRAANAALPVTVLPGGQEFVSVYDELDDSIDRTASASISDGE